MRVAIIGAGHIGANLARLLARAGHDVALSFSTDPAKLTEVADAAGARAASPAAAVASAPVVIISVPWGVFDLAIERAGGPGAFAGKLVIDTTNQFGRLNGQFGVLDLAGLSAARVHANAVPRAVWVKAFNTLTAGFQATSAGRVGADRVVMFYATDHEATDHEATDHEPAAVTVEKVINSAGFDPVRTGTLDRVDVGHQEPKGELYGEEFHHEQAVTAVARLRGTTPAGTGRP